MNIYKVEIWDSSNDDLPIDLNYVIGTFEDAFSYWNDWKSDLIRCRISYGQYTHDSQNHKVVFQPLYIHGFNEKVWGGTSVDEDRLYNAVQVEIP